MFFFEMTVDGAAAAPAILSLRSFSLFMARLSQWGQSGKKGMKNRGFGLIELLISSSLILFLIIGTAQLLGLSLAAKGNGEFLFRAARVASSKLEHFKSLPFESAELEAGIHEEDIRDPAFPRPCRIVWRVENPDEGLKKVILECFSPDKPQRRAVFCLLLCRTLEF